MTPSQAEIRDGILDRRAGDESAYDAALTGFGLENKRAGRFWFGGRTGRARGRLRTRWKRRKKREMARRNLSIYTWLEAALYDHVTATSFVACFK
jgi:hypothetical protein